MAPAAGGAARGGLEAPEGRWAVGGEWAAGPGAAGVRALGGLGPAPPRLTAGADAAAAPAAAAAAAAAGESGCASASAAALPPLLAASTGKALHFLRQRDTGSPGGAPLTPAREVPLPSDAGGQASCVALASEAPEDGRGLLVGLTGGDVLCLDLQQQLREASGRKVANEAVFQPGSGAAAAGSELAGCTCLAWAPQPQGAFVAGYADGSLRLFKKPAAWAGLAGGAAGGGEAPPATASGARIGPSSCWQVCGGAISALAFSADGQSLGVASRDGVFRVLDVERGTLVAGCRSYYGGFLCLAWSPDSRFVALGGEDDLVSVYSVRDRCVVAWGEGHRAWVSGVQWDPFAGGAAAAGAEAAEGPVYRIATVGQDTLLLLWDFEPPESGGAPGHRRAPSATSLPVPLSPSPSTTPGRHRRATSRSSDAPARSRTSSLSGQETELEGVDFSGQEQCIAVSVPRDDMAWMGPAAQVQAHQAPVCAVQVLRQGIATLCADARLHLWLRPAAPGAPAEAEAAPGGAGR